MKKILLLAALLGIVASSCAILQPVPDVSPRVDTQATIDSIVWTAAAGTLAAQPSPTAVPATETATSVPASSPTTEVSDAPSPTPVPNLTTTPATATSGPGDNPTATTTATKAQSVILTLTPTLGILKYGTLPPAVPFARITILNKSRTQAYISLQNRPPDRQVAILEYPVKKEVKVDAPLGYYLYVVWVGGRQIIGEFILRNGDELTIIIYRDRVEIN